MSEAAHFMEDARKSFRLASTAQEIDQMESYAKMGRDYMQLVRTAANVGTKNCSPSLWGKKNV